MVLALVLLGLLSIGLAYLWHQRIIGFGSLLLTIKSRIDSGKTSVSKESASAHCISHQWVVENVVRGKESRIGETIRNLVNNRTILGIFILGILIGPTAGMLVYLFYRSFAFFGASIAIIIIAVFLIRTSESVKTSYGLLSYLRTQDDSELKQNDVVYAELSLKIIAKWRMILLIIAVLSLVAAPWGEIIPDAVALATSGFLITVFTLVYPSVATYSHELAIITTLYVIPLSIALLYFLFRLVSRFSTSVMEKLHEIRPM
jgi:hypothetical protein